MSTTCSQEASASSLASVILVGANVLYALADRRDGQFPNPRAAARPHDMRIAVPLIEGADYADALRIRRPHRKTRSLHAVDGGNVGA